jgi:hypothetical protein
MGRAGCAAFSVPGPGQHGATRASQSDPARIPLLPQLHVRVAPESDARGIGHEDIGMKRRLSKFLHCESGAVSADFVVLTAGVIGLCMLFILPVLAESVNWGEAIATLALGYMDN